MLRSFHSLRRTAIKRAAPCKGVIEIFSLKSWLRSVLFTLFALLIAGCLYLFSNTAEELRLNTQIPKELGIEFTSPAELLAKSNYGGLEEGGDLSLVKLSVEDCSDSYEAIFSSKHRAKDKIFAGTDVEKFLQKNKVSFKKVISSYQIDKKGNSLFYAIDRSQCLIVRDAYFE